MKKFKGQRILVAEDNLISFKLIEAHFRRLNLHPVHANDGKAALEIFRKDKKISAILMDIQLPGMDGLQVTRVIRETDPEIPVIATTANAFEEDRLACEEAGCNHFLTKPIEFTLLFEILDRYIS